MPQNKPVGQLTETEAKADLARLAAEIRAALKEMGIGPRELLRRRGSPYDDLGLGKPKWTDAELVAAMAKHPLLIERPVVRTRKGTRLCRPSERLKDIL